MGRRSQLTVDQQRHLRAKMMSAAGTVASQIQEYLDTDKVVIAGNEIAIDATRVKVWQMTLGKALPDLHHTEIEKTNPLEGKSSEQLIEQLTTLAKSRPKLMQRLHEAVGGKVVEAEAVERKEEDES